MLIDIGVNLTSSQFEKDRLDVMNRAQAAHVSHMVVTGTSLQGSQEALELAIQFPKLLSATAGVHPHDAKSVGPTTWTEIRTLA